MLLLQQTVTIPLVVKDRVDLAGVGHVDQVVPHRRGHAAVFREVLPRPDVEPAVDLPGVRGDDLGAERVSNVDGQPRLAAGGRTHQDQ